MLVSENDHSEPEGHEKIFGEKTMNFDEYENELIESEDDLLAQAKEPGPEEMKQLIEAARHTLNKDKRINIRISSRDLGALQRKANRYGMPYQTLISSVLHRYITGDLGEGLHDREVKATEAGRVAERASQPYPPSV